MSRSLESRASSTGTECASHRLHLEAYTPGTTKNARWHAGGGCPENLLDPSLVLLLARSRLGSHKAVDESRVGQVGPFDRPATHRRPFTSPQAANAVTKAGASRDNER